MAHSVHQNVLRLVGKRQLALTGQKELRVIDARQGSLWNCRCLHTENTESRRRQHQEQNSNSRSRKAALAVGLAGAVGAGLYWKYAHDQKKSPLSNFTLHSKVLAAELEPGKFQKNLPTFSEEEVAKHNSKASGIWVTLGNGVYDITEYVVQHPGGTKILMAAGKSIEPFWALYSVHKSEEIYEILESYRIGNIKTAAAAVKADDPYKNDPERSALLIPSSSKPFNAEPPLSLLADQFITPNHMFFVRNHLPVPDVNVKNFTLDLVTSPRGGKTVSLSYDDLKTKFAKHSVTSTIQCAGNRRSEMVKVKPVKGLNWNGAAISNAKFSGVSLNELLLQNGVNLDTVRAKYIVFEGLDTQPDGSPYGASIPLELAQMLKHDLLIAYEMNGEPLPRDHGYPLRIIIPGVVGARQVKWLKKIYFSPEESTSHWQRNDYKGFNTSIDWHNVDFNKSVSISQLPVISAICEPAEGAEIEAGAESVPMKGYAWSGGGRAIIRVDVSTDGGQTWHEATLKPNNQSHYRSYAWTLWEADVPVDPTRSKKDIQLVAKAIDISYNVQPENVAAVWNLRGCLSNAWHRVNVSLLPEEK